MNAELPKLLCSMTCLLSCWLLLQGATNLPGTVINQFDVVEIQYLFFYTCPCSSCQPLHLSIFAESELN